MTEQPEYFLILKDEVNFMRTSMFSDREECRKIMQKVIARPHAPYQSERVSEEKPCDHCDFQEIENTIWKAEQTARASERDKVLDAFKEVIRLHDEDELLYPDLYNEFLVIYKSQWKQAGEP
jgi:hypothetical protein